MPTSEDAVAFIEVSHSTYVGNRTYGIPLDVRAGVPSWIVNIELRLVEEYANEADLELPHGIPYACGETFEVCGVSIAVADLFDAKVTE